MPERSAAQYLRPARRPARFVYLARPASPELVTAVNALGEPGIVFNREPERLYPQTAMAGHVIGWTDTGGRGIGGMEQALAGPADRSRPARRRRSRCRSTAASRR